MKARPKNNTAVFSPCRTYRYTLWRVWDDTLPYCQFIGLNPSTADETNDDPTIRRCIRFAKDWGCGALCMTNIFAYRATNPKDMKAQEFPTGDLNGESIIDIAKEAGIVIAAWGIHGDHESQGAKVNQLFDTHSIKLHCLGKTMLGHPKHPLYIKADTKPELF